MSVHNRCTYCSREFLSLKPRPHCDTCAGLYERGRADERAAIVKWLRGCTDTQCLDRFRSASIEEGAHMKKVSQ